MEAVIERPIWYSKWIETDRHAQSGLVKIEKRPSFSKSIFPESIPGEREMWTLGSVPLQSTERLSRIKEAILRFNKFKTEIITDVITSLMILMLGLLVAHPIMVFAGVATLTLNIVSLFMR